eukprot:Blabericola_migrator_1__7510@NODE_3837_length_1477_cov_76_729787_g2325_i1_p1_GENE_NODE_3837_length_1477_cov_76_729787_g2325_i1NODE_3837_length_1477_cov_76_729787_g2325_i1_p1_ORF_typecomplete_len441_score59_22DHH/PF01368_20/1_9e09ICE2/PF08426_10/1_2e03ICE2/PF08426_10/0_22DUF3636/PF12331_8/0_21_NODE_3837_length_1477_cov_76_729787_g2325_i1771399
MLDLELASWLRALKISLEAELRNDGSDVRFIIVLGNSACDMDSMVSSLVVAYHLYVTRTKVAEFQHKKLVAIPVFNCNRAKYGDSHWYRQAFDAMGLPSWSSFFFIDDPNIRKLMSGDASSPQLEGILVDHNHVDASNEIFWNRKIIHGIIDHHEQKFAQSSLNNMPISKTQPRGGHTLTVPETNEDVTIFQRYRNEYNRCVGSCVTVIWDIILHSLSQNKKKKKLFSISSLLNSSLVNASMMAITEDTHNFSPAYYCIRWHDLDFDVFEALAHHSSMTSDKIRARHNAIKRDWIKHQYSQPWSTFLHLDEKVFAYKNGQHTIVWSSVTGSLSKHLEHKSIESLIEDATKSNTSAQTFIVTGLYKEDEDDDEGTRGGGGRQDAIRREILIFTKPPWSVNFERFPVAYGLNCEWKLQRQNVGSCSVNYFYVSFVGFKIVQT